MLGTKGETKDQQLIRRWGALKTERTSWMSHWQDISRYIMPRTGRFLADDTNKGQPKTNLVYDNTATRAARTLAAGMLGGMSSPARPWFRLTTGDEELDEYQSVKIWLSDVTKRMQRLFSGSNTYRALHTIYLDLGLYGVSAATVLDDFEDGICLYNHAVGEYALSCDYKGRINGIYREFKKTTEQLVAEFGIEKCSTHAQNLFREGNLDAWHTVLHAVEPRTARDPRRMDAGNMAWMSAYVEMGTDARAGTMLRESGFRRFRTLAPRWMVEAQDIYGASCGMDVLGDVKQLQHEQLRKSQGIDYQTKPPVQVPNSLKSAGVDMLPGGVTYVDSVGAGNAIQTLFNVNLNLEYLLQDIQDVRMRINAGFYADLFLMLSQADGRMTATEVAERHEEKLLMLGPVLERLHNELLDPLIEIAFERLIEMGELPEAPPEMEGRALSVEFVSLLAQAQRAVGTNSIDRFVIGIMGVANARPEVLDKFDADQWADVYADSLGIDPSLVRGDDEVAKIRQARAAQEQQAVAQEQAAVAADTAAKLGGIKTSEPNALNDILGNLSGYGSPASYRY